ncbi:MAG: caspase family protein, partial [Saprospiraceae bacterium]
MKTIYALLVGVDNYPPPTPKLGGAKNDINKIKSYLEKNFNDRPLHIKTLLDQEVTYDNFIDSFRTHLGQAGSEDVVWFHYSGHGSRQFSAPEFVELNSGGRDETMVLYDSRPSGQDLADKEMAVLLSELSEKDPHIMVTLDCCH